MQEIDGRQTDNTWSIGAACNSIVMIRIIYSGREGGSGTVNTSQVSHNYVMILLFMSVHIVRYIATCLPKKHLFFELFS